MLLSPSFLFSLIRHAVLNIRKYLLKISMCWRREIPYLQASMNYMVYYINVITTTFFDDFQKISENSVNVVRRHYERFQTSPISFPDFRRLSRRRLVKTTEEGNNKIIIIIIIIIIIMVMMIMLSSNRKGRLCNIVHGELNLRVHYKMISPEHSNNNGKN